MDDERPKANPMPTSAPQGYHAPEVPKPKESMMERVQDFVTGGASETMKKAIQPKNMNYYHEDDGK
jgi:hypothetical protein